MPRRRVSLTCCAAAQVVGEESLAGGGASGQAATTLVRISCDRGVPFERALALAAAAGASDPAAGFYHARGAAFAPGAATPARALSRAVLLALPSSRDLAGERWYRIARPDTGLRPEEVSGAQPPPPPPPPLSY